MLKFATMWDTNRAIREHWEHKSKFNTKRQKLVNEAFIPTVDEVDEFNARGVESAIRQILHGQSVHYGYDIDHDYDNEIRDVKAWKALCPPSNGALKRRIEISERRKGPRIMMKFWKSIYSKCRRGPSKLTSAHRKIINACVANGNYTREEAIEMAIILLGPPK